VAAWVNKGEAIIVNQSGYSERKVIGGGDEKDQEGGECYTRLSEWSTEGNKLFNNPGPIIDFVINGDSTLCVAGLSPYSGFYEIK
jgi:hypothetical protein